MSSRGYILPFAVVLCTILAASALRLAQGSAGLYRSAKRDYERARLICAAESAVEILRMEMERDDRETDGAGDAWFRHPDMMLDGHAIHVQITDEQGKLNINALEHPSGELHRELFRVYLRGCDGPSCIPATTGQESFQRNRKRLRQIGFGMLPTPGYASILHPGTARHRSAAVDEWITVHGNGRINLNSASPFLVDLLLPGESGESADRLIRERERAPFRSVFDIKQRVGLSEEEFRGILAIGDVRSSVFRLHAEVTGREETAVVEAIIQRDRMRSGIIRYRRWWVE